MNRRLLTIAGLIEGDTGLIDVGTDHGYLPLYLAQNAYPGKLFASDINKDPLSKARRAACEAGLSEQISFILCDGLDCDVANDVDSIVIAGMGGETICGILDRSEWYMDSRYTLILQPMTKAEVLRYWLVNNGFSIVAERLVEDSGAIYQIIKARFGGTQKLRDAELFTGAYQLVKNELLFRRRLQTYITRFNAAVEGMRTSNDASDKNRLKLYEEILTQLLSMEEEDNDRI